MPLQQLPKLTKALQEVQYMGQIDEDARNRRKQQQLAEMAIASTPMFSVNADDARELNSMTATQIRDMYSKITFPSAAPDIWGKKLIKELLSQGAIHSIPPAAKDGEIGGPRTHSELIEEEVPVAPVPEDAFAVHVAVTAQLSAKDLYTSKMAKQITNEVHNKRSKETMHPRSLLVVYVHYDDIGVRVMVTTNASLSKAIVEVVDTENVQPGQAIFSEDMTYDQFEAYQSPVPDAGDR